MNTTEPIEAYEDTLFHIEMIKKKRAKLLNAQLDAERQVLHRIGRDYVAGKLTDEDLYVLYARYRNLSQGSYEKRPGFSSLWDESVPFNHMRIDYYVRNMTRHTPNQGASWVGEWPILEGTYPASGKSVVYVLFDEENEPCYIGSTFRFRQRLKMHHRDKRFARWLAYPCSDRESAYLLEEKLLAEHKPYLNKRVGR